jgi:hypothetical protein
MDKHFMEGIQAPLSNPLSETEADELYSDILYLINEVRKNVNDLNIHAARTNLAEACRISSILNTAQFDNELLNAEGMCTALEFQQLAPPEDRRKFRNLASVFGQKLGFAV